MQILVTLLLLYSALSFAQKPLMLNESGLNVLQGHNAFNVNSIKQALPAYQVVQGTGYTENQPYPIINVSLKEESLLTIHGSAEDIASIITHSNQVSSHTGHKVGDLFMAIYTTGQYQCHVGFEEWSGYALCLAPESEHIYFVFKKTNLPDAELPTTEQLNPERIRSIFWSRG